MNFDQHPWAQTAAGALAATGLVLAWNHLAAAGIALACLGAGVWLWVVTHP